VATVPSDDLENAENGFSYLDFDFEAPDGEGGEISPTADLTAGGISAVQSLLPDLEARAAQMDAENEDLAW